MSVRIKAALVIILIVFAITAANFASSMFFTRQGLIETMERWQRLDSSLANNLISTQVFLLKSNAAMVAERLRNVPKEEMPDIMRTQLKEFPNFMAFTVFNRTEEVASCGNFPTSAHYLKNSPYLHSAFEGKSVISTTRYEPDAGYSLFFHVCVPIEENLVLSATIPGTFFCKLVSEYRFWQTGSIFVIDEQGTLIAHSNALRVNERLNYIEKAKTDPDMQSIGKFFEKMISNKRGSGVYSLHGQERVCAYQRISASTMGWVVGVVAPIDESPQIKVQQGLLVSSLLFLIAGVIIAVCLSNAVVWPFSKIEEQNRHLEILNQTVQQQKNDILKEHERIKALLDSMPLTLHLWEKDGSLFDCNEETVKLFQAENKEEYVNHFGDFSPEYQPDGQNSCDKAVAYIKKAYEDGKSVFEWMHQRKNGESVPTEVTLVRVRYGNEAIVAGYVRDLQEHKQMLQDIERRDKLLKVGNTIATILLSTTDEDQFKCFLQESMELLGRCLNVDRVQFMKNEMINGSLSFVNKYQWLSDVGRQKVHIPIGLQISYSDRPIWKNIFLRGKCVNGPISTLSRASRIFLNTYEIVSIVVIPLMFQGQFWGLFVLDDCRQERVFPQEEIGIIRSVGLMMMSVLQKNEITRNFQTIAAELETVLREAREANQAKSDFLANMSHEMRTPLNAILGLSTLVLEADDLDTELHANIEKIYNTGHTLLNTVNDILDISKIEAGKLELIFSEYDVPSVIDDILVQNLISVGDKDIDFILNVDESLPARLYGDDMRIKQIFNNLLSNAFKYTQRGTVELSINGIRDGDSIWLIFRVQDTGIGIRTEDIDSLFKNYSQVDVKSNRHIEGTGLGLSISKQLAEMMGGYIQAESEHGKGSTFTVHLRQKLVTDAVIGAELAENLKKLKYSDSKRAQNTKVHRIRLPYAQVLVVDDIVVNLDVAKGLLKPYAMRVHCVTCGQQAIDAIREEKVRYNAVFMDHMMPVMDGVETVRQIRQIETDYAKNIPIIAMTANAIVGSEQMFLDNGFQAFLSKPIDIARLDGIIRLWIRDENQEKGYTEQQVGVNGQEQSEKRSEIDISALSKIVETDMDMKKALQRFGGNLESLLNVLRSFVVNTSPLLETLEEMNEDNMADYAITIHGIKGSCQGICADDAAEKALLLENTVKSGNFNFVRSRNAEFLESVFKLLAGIKTLLDEAGVNSRKQKKDKPDIDVLEKLRTACDNYDMDGVDAAMSIIERYEYTSDDGLADWLRQNVEQMNFSQIKEKLSILIGQLD